LFGDYYAEQFRLLQINHAVEIEIGVSKVPVPVHFAFPDDIFVAGDLNPERLQRLGEYFDLPDLATMDASIVNGTHEPGIIVVGALVARFLSDKTYRLGLCGRSFISCPGVGKSARSRSEGAYAWRRNTR
jgi:hypothetical protein